MEREIMLFAYRSLKNRHGFDSDDVLMYLSAKGINIDKTGVEEALDEMVHAYILDRFYSDNRERMIYRLH